MDFYEKILKGQLRANKSNSNFDLIDSLDTSFLEKVNLKFCKFVLGISKKSVNTAHGKHNLTTLFDNSIWVE
jgi:hypothetical protein